MSEITSRVTAQIAYESEQGIARLRAENEELRARLVALEDEKNAYIDYVGNGLGQGDDESLWDAAQRVLSDRDRYRVIVDRLLEAADDNPFCTVGHFCEHGPVSSEIETARVRAMLELEEGE